MGVADTARFYMKPGQAPVVSSGPPPRFRPPPPPEERRPVMSRRVEYAETSSDGEDAMFDPIIPDYRSLDRRKTNYAAGLQQKYKTLEPRSRSGGGGGGGEAHSLERLNSRRVLPDVPSHSLPRQGKRTQSDSRTRERLEDGGKRSQSHGDQINDNRRKLPTVPNGRDLREPTPDYDSPPPGEGGGRRRNSDSGVLDIMESPRDSQAGGGGGVKRHATTLDKSGNKRQLVSSLDTSLESQESKGE